MAIKLVLLSGVFCVAAACAATASLAWKSKVESKRWEQAESASRLTLENTRLVQQVAAQRRSIALLRNECSIRAMANSTGDTPRPGEPSNATAPPATAETMVELRQMGDRVEVAPGGPMSPISN